MLLPAFLHGKHRDVKAACRRQVTQLKRGASWQDLTGDLIDTADHPGLLVVDGPSVLLGGQPHFHLFAMVNAIQDAIPQRLPPDIHPTLFEPAIHTVWGFLGMLGWQSLIFLRSDHHQQRLLHLAVRWWPSIVAEGDRYSAGIDPGEPLWELPTKLHYCLLHQGLPEELDRQPVPEGGIAELVAMTRASLPPTPEQLH